MKKLPCFIFFFLFILEIKSNLSEKFYKNERILTDSKTNESDQIIENKESIISELKKDNEKLLEQLNYLKVKDNKLFISNSSLEKENLKIKFELKEKELLIKNLQKQLKSSIKNETTSKNIEDTKIQKITVADKKDLNHRIKDNLVDDKKQNLNDYIKSIRDILSLTSEFQTFSTEFQLESIKEKSLEEDIKKELNLVDKSNSKIVKKFF